MSRFFAVFTRRPLAWIGGALVMFWAVYVGSVLRPRLALPPLDTSRPVLVTMYDRTLLVQAAPDGTVNTVSKNVGPVAPWQKGLVYWNRTKSCLFLVLPDLKARALWPHPALSKIKVESLIPAPDAVYLNARTTANYKKVVVRVRLSDGASQTMPQMQSIHTSDYRTAYACLTPKNVIVVHYPSGKIRTVSPGGAVGVEVWDYDAARDAVIWLGNDAVCYNSPTRTWRKAISNPSSVGGSQANGDVWVQTAGAFEAQGVYVLSKSGVERGWRWRSKTLYSADYFVELSPQQEKLARALPNTKK